MGFLCVSFIDLVRGELNLWIVGLKLLKKSKIVNISSPQKISLLVSP